MIPKQLVLVLRMTSLCYVFMRVLRGYDARKNQKTFVFSLAYSYLCRRYDTDIADYTYHVARCSAK
ncbi:hypothetical protein SAMN04487828_2402 [Prevotella sp. lc2012]|nr:hypothetical protein SAMN04487828_2402 [Prevotella sp. lc2012]